MTRKMENAVPGSTAFKVCSAEQRNSPYYTHAVPNVHRVLQAERLRHRFGLSPIRAELVARFAYGGGVHG